MTVPLPLLLTFVVVARRGSMKAAAAELAVTPGAVSQRIRELEERDGRRLFARTGAGVTLTDAGRRLFAALDEPFRRIETAQTGFARRSRRRRLVVNVVPSFASSWLVPRLGGFSRLHPDIDVAIETDNRLVDPRREPVDLVIRHGLGRYPGLRSVWLMAPELLLVASPALLAQGRPIRTPADCLAYPLLQDGDRRDWPLWLQAQGVAAEGADHGPAFADDYLLVRAAASGQGLALVRDIYAAEELRRGDLVRVLAGSWPTALAYYLAGTRRSLDRPAVKRFADWLVGEAQSGR